MEQVNQQMALVDELAAVTSSPDALQVLQQTRQLLEQRLQKATTPAPAAPPDY